jgi:hypothetical protein
MQKGATVFRLVCALVALQVPFSGAALAGEVANSVGQAGEDRWVPSLAITSGLTIQKLQGSVDSVLFQPETNPTAVPLQGSFDDDDLAVSPFVGGSLEVMTPALPIPLRPRLFMSGEILPTFDNERRVAVDKNPGCLRGPEVGAPCVMDIVGLLDRSFAEDAVIGQGSLTTADIDTLVYGASFGVSFPARIAERQIRIKPSAGWITYKVDSTGTVVDAACPTYPPQPQINPNKCIPIVTDPQGALRETVLMGSGSQRFHGIGGGLDIEMDTIRYGPLGVSLFLGARAYRILGDRTIAFSAEQTFGVGFDGTGMQVFPAERSVAAWEVEVDPWMYRAHVGIRFQWLGSGN